MRENLSFKNKIHTLPLEDFMKSSKIFFISHTAQKKPIFYRFNIKYSDL
ncbi:hypothetical protein SAMN04488104_100423 [Algoriphagus faecimaris]|uniref:Uncharacterized protein n=1 Tax=Algoriphagus faecimaris TaxID=686796 RepID=A0A1G6NQC1_9BACT|nr:hypothetical protein SAMN04488104_100423 [Algoriphagus faecimaris]